MIITGPTKLVAGSKTHPRVFIIQNNNTGGSLLIGNDPYSLATESIAIPFGGAQTPQLTSYVDIWGTPEAGVASVNVSVTFLV